MSATQKSMLSEKTIELSGYDGEKKRSISPEGRRRKQKEINNYMSHPTTFDPILVEHKPGGCLIYGYLNFQVEGSLTMFPAV